MGAADSWHVEHTHFEHLLDYLEGQLGVLRDGGSPNYDRMRDVAHYLSYFGARYHHSRENVAFRYIVQSNPAMSAKIDQLLQEHVLVEAKGGELDTLLAKTADGDAAARANVEAVLATYLTSYRDHIGAEEQDILPYAAETLSAMEWASVASAAPPGPDPFREYSSRRHNPTFGSEAETRYRALCEMIPRRRPTQSREERPRPNLENRQGYGTEVAGVRAATRRNNPVARVAPASQLLAGQPLMLLALVMAYLQYYFLDVYLQIERLPSLNVFLIR